MNKIKVSVIIPVYNEERYLEQCIRSIQNQTCREIEILCVDDGSTDASPAIVERLAEKDSRVKLLTQQNKGGGAARNLGKSRATGTYLAFLDSDDFFEPNMLEGMYEQCEKTQADLCVCKAKCYHEDLQFDTPEPAALREEFLPEREVFSWKDMPEHIFNTFHNWPWNKMFRRSFIEEKRIDFQEIRRTNDLFFTCRALMEAERITVVKEEFVNYRVGVPNSCQATNDKMPLDFYHAFLALKEYLIEQGIFEQVKQSYVNHALDGCMANLNSLDGKAVQEELYQRLRDEIFEQLCIKGQPCDYFYPQNQRSYRGYQVMQNGNYLDYLRNRIEQLKEERADILISEHGIKMYLIDKHDRVYEAYQKERYDLLHCREYRIGTKIMYLPLKVRNLLRRKK